MNLFKACLIVLLLTSCDKDDVVAEEDLPQNARDFVTTHFSTQAISQVVKDKDGSSVNYEVTLDNGTEIDFTENGTCTSMEGFTELPEDVIPQSILQYVEENYSQNFIIAWELNRSEQEVEINNGVEIKFDLEGNFLRVDN